jgi:putative tricarboxylic transport membrane protein
MTKKNMGRADFYTAVALIAFGITALVMALQMPAVEERGQSPYSAPGLLPATLGIVIAGLGGILLVRSLVRTKGRVGVSGSSFKKFFTETGTIRIIITIALCLSYTALLGNIFFPLLTFLFVFAFVFCFEYKLKESLRSQVKKILAAVLLAVCTSAGVTLVFQYLFLVRLP